MNLSMTKPFDPNNQEPRMVMTPQGLADLDIILDDDTVFVWQGKQDNRTNRMRPHLQWNIKDVGEVE
jgi:hypothetical protein